MNPDGSPKLEAMEEIEWGEKAGEKCLCHEGRVWLPAESSLWPVRRLLSDTLGLFGSLGSDSPEGPLLSTS